jgi:hypothetical protein
VPWDARCGSAGRPRTRGVAGGCLAERFYILDPGTHGTMGSFLGGIRSHQKARNGIGSLAAWYYGPFWSLLNSRPRDALALINQMLDHAATARAPGWQEPAGDPARVTGLELDLPGTGTRWCVADDQTWRWYRGGSAAPYPCVSALLAVERFADQLLRGGLPAGDLVRALLRDCRNLAMPGLVTGLLIRHPAHAGNLLDNWLAQPEIWHMEAARAAAEGMLHVQGTRSR